MLSWLSSLCHWSVVPFHWKLVLPRSTLLLLSFGAEIIFYRLISLFHTRLDTKARGIIMNYYGIAHVTLVFFTRTLSNSFESFLFVALIYSIALNVRSIRLQIDPDETGKIAKTVRKKTSLVMDSSLMLTSASIGLICALGIFNRPTFPAFAVVPILYWFIAVVLSTTYSSRIRLFLGRIISVILGAFLLIASVLILFDSFYYNNGLSFVIDLKTRLIVCPLNFILYNVNTENLDKHGLHPPWLHFLVNATLLFGPLHLCAVVWVLSRLISLKSRMRPTTVSSGMRRFSWTLALTPFMWSWNTTWCFLSRTIDGRSSVLSLLCPIYSTVHRSSSGSSLSAPTSLSSRTVDRSTAHHSSLSSIDLSSLARLQSSSRLALRASASRWPCSCTELRAWFLLDSIWCCSSDEQELSDHLSYLHATRLFGDAHVELWNGTEHINSGDWSSRWLARRTCSNHCRFVSSTWDGSNSSVCFSSRHLSNWSDWMERTTLSFSSTRTIRSTSRFRSWIRSDHSSALLDVPWNLDAISARCVPNHARLNFMHWRRSEHRARLCRSRSSFSLRCKYRNWTNILWRIVIFPLFLALWVSECLGWRSIACRKSTRFKRTRTTHCGNTRFTSISSLSLYFNIQLNSNLHFSSGRKGKLQQRILPPVVAAFSRWLINA